MQIQDTMHLLLEFPGSAARHSFRMCIHGPATDKKLLQILCGVQSKKCMESQEPEQSSPKKGAGYRDYVTSRLFSFSSKAISSLSENGVKVL